MLENVGIPNKKYRYFDWKHCKVDFEGMCEDINNIPPNNIILLQPCAHNPTGCDPTHE